MSRTNSPEDLNTWQVLRSSASVWGPRSSQWNVRGSRADEYGAVLNLGQNIYFHPEFLAWCKTFGGSFVDSKIIKTPVNLFISRLIFKKELLKPDIR